MRRSLAPFSGPELLVHTRSLADCITTTSGFRFSVHTGMKTLQKFAAAHAPIHNHFNHDRHLNPRDIFKQNRAAALAEWRQLAA
jgi:hypothetical protein